MEIGFVLKDDTQNKNKEWRKGGNEGRKEKHKYICSWNNLLSPTMCQNFP